MTQRGSALNFRDFVENLLATGDAVDIREPVSPVLEAAAVTRRVYETRSPAPLFSNPTGSEPGFRMLGAPAGLSGTGGNTYGRLAAHFGLPVDTAPRELVERLIAAMHAEPSPRAWWRRDPARRTSSPVTTSTWSASPSRCCTSTTVAAISARTATTWCVPPTGGGRAGRSAVPCCTAGPLVGPAMAQQHLGMIHAMWRAQGLPTPWAMVLGAPPAALAAAGMPLPAGVNEDGYVGALVGSPVEVVRTELHDLYVPANAEIVLEGHISPDETAPEGRWGSTTATPSPRASRSRSSMSRR